MHTAEEHQTSNKISSSKVYAIIALNKEVSTEDSLLRPKTTRITEKEYYPEQN